MKERPWKNEDSNYLFRAILKLETRDEVAKFFRDLFTLEELEEMSTRFKIARILSEENPPSYAEIAKTYHVSTTTVTRVAHWLNNGSGGYQMLIDRLN